MTNQTNRKSFIIHKDSLVILDEMSNEQAGIFIKSIKFYQEKGCLPELDFGLKMAITPFINQFQRDEQIYKKTCEARREAGSKGGKSYYIKDSGIDNQGEMQFYVLKLFNEDENFIKIGISSAKLNRRFSGPKNMPYNYEILHQIINEKEALKLESYFSKKLENYKYQTAIKFPGHIECYKLEALSLIVNDDLFAQAKQSKSYQKVANLADNDNKNKSESESKNKNENKNEIKNNSNLMENHNIENNSKGVEIEAVKNKKFTKPTIQEIKDYCFERKNNVDANKFFNYYEANGWKVGKNPMKDWQACVRTWEGNNYNSKQTQPKHPSDNEIQWI